MKQDKIGVFVRVRPYQEKQLQSTFILSMNDTNINVKDKDRDKQQDLNFTFDHIFQVKSTQKDVFDKIGKPIVDSAFNGINGTIFAYGQTSSGKTYTCVGPNCQDPQEKGLLPRCVTEIFERISLSSSHIQYRIKISMVEIYMEKIRDLLDPSKTDLKLRQNKTKGIYIQDVTEDYVSSAEETMKVFKRGVSNRVVAFTNMNDMSSRSHMAFILTLHQNNLKDGSAKSGKITVVDLAGSEKVSKTHAEGRVLDEAKQINKSLSSLGNVINALTDPKTGHIPYRDSKLTRLLQQSIGGNSKTSLIINISPSIYNSGESISSLRFGFRAKQIKNKPKINKQYTISELLLLLQKSQKRNQELELLLKQLTARNSKKAKSKENSYIENLLDSENPLMSAISDNQLEQQLPINRSTLKALKKCYQSQIGSQGQQEMKLSKKSSNSNKIGYVSAEQLERIKLILQEKEEEIKIISQELVRVNNERIENGRQLDICKQRLQLVIKQAKLSVMKLNAEKRQNEQLLQKFIKQNLQNNERQQKLQKLNSKIKQYEDKFIRLSQIQQSQIKKNNVFGIDKKYNEQTSKIINEVLKNTDECDESKQIRIQNIQKQKLNKQLKDRIKQLQQQIILYKNLQKVKQDLIKQKINFVQQRQRVYKDLQNRIQKVLQLQQKLDQQRQWRKNLQEIIKIEQSDKNRRILSLQRQINQINQNYYVLKGQQSSWLKNNKKIEQKLQQQNNKINKLQQINLQLRVQVQDYRIRFEQFEALNENHSHLDVQLQDDRYERGNGNIVKIIKSNIYN